MFNNPDFKGQYIVIVISILLIEIGLCGLYDLNKGFNIAAAVMFILFFIPGVYFICKSVYTIISRMKLRIKTMNHRHTSLYCSLFCHLLYLFF